MEASTATPPSTALAPAQDVTDLVLRPSPDAAIISAVPLSPRARAKFSQGSLDLLAQRYAGAIKDGADVRAFMGLIEQSAELDLNPNTGQIWLVKFNGKWQTMVGRDGYLAIARRHPDFLSCDGAVHREKDEFSAQYDHERGWVVNHKMVGGNRQRGKVLGAWALLRRVGSPDAYFYADYETYGKAGGTRKNAWDTHEDAMILKCPQSHLPRTTYGISGPMPADEIQLGMQPGATVNTTVPVGGAEGEPRQTAPDIPEALLVLLRRAHAVDKARWRRNEIYSRIPPVSVDPDGHRHAIEEITAEVTAWLDQHEIKDAVVVDDAATNAVAEATPPTIQERYESDAKWRKEVERYLGNRSDLESAIAGDDDPKLLSDLETVNETLRGYGIPDGWFPAQPGQQAMPL